MKMPRNAQEAQGLPGMHERAEQMKTVRNAEQAQGALLWRSRRGMLEVELKLLPFARTGLCELAPADREAYARLLQEDDWQLHDWLQGWSAPADPALARIVGRIRGMEPQDGA